MTASAPAAPGKLGTPLETQDALTYIGALGDWVAERKRELDALDAAILAAENPSRFTSDIVLSMSLWQAVKARYDLILTTWDSGRVGPKEREQLSQLVWRRLDDALPDSGAASPQPAGLSGLSVSLPEACRLSDALAGQLRSSLQIDPAAGRIAIRIRDLRAQADRLRDQVALEPAVSRPTAEAKLASIVSRIADIAARSERGGDVGGLIGPLEIDAATFERDLIVNNTVRRQARDTLQRARDLSESLSQRESALEDLVERTIAAVHPAPKYAVPQVSALGPIPNTPAAIETYLAKLGKVASAMQIVQDTYGKALQTREELVAEVGRVVSATGDADLDALGETLKRFAERRPTPVSLVRRLLDAYREGSAIIDTSKGATS